MEIELNQSLVREKENGKMKRHGKINLLNWSSGRETSPLNSTRERQITYPTFCPFSKTWNSIKYTWVQGLHICNSFLSFYFLRVSFKILLIDWLILNPDCSFFFLLSSQTLSPIHLLSIHSSFITIHKGAGHLWISPNMTYEVTVRPSTSPCIKVEQGKPE